MTGHRAMNSTRAGRRIAARRQRGVVMWVALGVLIVMTLAGLGMIRQMGGGLSIAGNVAFKQSATALADLGTEEARAWLIANSTVLDTTNAAAGYHATWGTVADPVVGDDPSAWTADWNAVTATTDPATGNAVKWVVHRLCQLEGVSPDGVGQHCSSANAAPPCSSPNCSPITQTLTPYFRITTQVVGPRNTVSYIQVIVSA